MIFNDLRIGKSVEGSDILAFKTEQKANSYNYFIAGLHGNEVEGTYLLKKLFDWLKNNDEIEVPMVIVPILNVDGYRMGTKANAHAVDLDRHFKSENWKQDLSNRECHTGDEPGVEPEVKFMSKLFEKYRPGLVVSFHSWKPILAYNGEKAETICHFLSAFNHYVTNDLSTQPKSGSLAAYLLEKYHCPVVNYVCPTLKQANGLQEIWEENKLPLIKLMTSGLLLNKKD